MLVPEAPLPTKNCEASTQGRPPLRGRPVCAAGVLLLVGATAGAALLWEGQGPGWAALVASALVLGAAGLGFLAGARPRRRLADAVAACLRAGRAIAEENGLGMSPPTENEVEELAAFFDRFGQHLQTQRDELGRALERSRTFEKAAQQGLAVSQEAEAASRMKSQFLANMSHEIRTPMSGVLGMSELLANTRLDASQRRYAETIRRSAESLLNILNDILDFSKIEAGKLRLDVVEFDLRTEVEGVVELFAEHAHAKEIELLCALPTDLPSALRGDPGRLRQVLSNLVGNALKFTERGEVVVHVALEEETEETVFVRFEVTDTGIGIPRGAQTHIFDFFSQFDAGERHCHRGTGLGLAISKQLVGMMGGEIGVDSSVGEGSAFSFTVRFVRRQTEENRADRHAPSRLAGLRVLVVDDNLTSRDLLKLELAAWCQDVGTASSGIQALVRLRAAAQRREAYDVAVLDLLMPGMDGLDLARRIKADASIRSTELVMLTSMGVPGDAAELAESGIRAYLSKPVRQSHLYEALKSAIGGREPSPGTAPTPSEDPGEAARFAGRVLLAEDSRVHLEVTLDMLGLLGCDVELAGDGSEVLSRLETERYDLILMDCQMPEVDGYEATAIIRQQEGERNLPRTPIVALTAHALQGDREECLRAGMDDYLAKPFRLDELSALLGRWLPAAGDEADATGEETGDCHEEAAPSAAAEVVSAARDRPPAAIDLEVLESLRKLQREGKPDLVAQVIEIYLEDTAKLLGRLRDAVRTANTEAIRQAAHSMKSGGANVGARRLAELCKQMEGLGRQGALESASVLFAEVEAEVAAVRETLDGRERGGLPC